MTAPTSEIAAAAQALRDAAATVAKVRVYDVGSPVDPPGVVVGPPSFRWTNLCGAPTEATFPVWVISAFSEYAMEQLWDLAPAVAAAIDKLPNATVTDADPSVFTSAGRDLPCYTLTVEVTL